jgi:ATP adenylyltransferase
MRYLESPVDRDHCFLCSAADDPDESDLVVWRCDRAFALLNAYPYANGHVMVAPKAHEGALLALDEPTSQEIMAVVKIVMRGLERAYRPEGFNVGANLGSAAGAGFAEHLHVHVVPRWSGDTNFMTATGNTRVIPEALDVTAGRLRRALEELQEET